MNKPDSMRIPPITHDQWTDEVRDILSAFSETFGRLGLGGDESEKDNLSPVLSCVLQHPALARVFFPFARYLLMETTLDNRVHELIVLRVSWLWRSEYEWAQHSMMAVNNGVFSQADIERITQGVNAGPWSEQETHLLSAIDQLRESTRIDNQLWDALAGHFDRKQLIDIIFLIGGYILVGMYLNTFGVPLKDGMKGFDQQSTGGQE
ncbi:carboxymuconolactone decarboxylase family protein [Ketobacter sp. MCCC 1A13808]|uniref:carboxymuconolactone decarboxylase family protein n=1 Tax=Ketobacter sp. MCCC 1A13808 TaxID=2602738 RepID=UPI000F26C585|nr:carboxymuconolactone decarboxylase family protein [Ketobacter sp. MCCC 1A13808]MVF14510.1 carboxymuconolactone decarboxylase family protein [Ketobacter sp. MCCC 1A13808]RLP55022.1 MAG: carboxymuconolactone decarboxylase family protein [Ketobacter sp.]